MLRTGTVWAAVLAAFALLAGCGSPQRIVAPKHVPVMSRPSAPPPAVAVPSTSTVKPAPTTSSPVKPPPAPERPNPRGDLRGAHVVVDAGHGGTDPGTQGLSNVPEKSITLAISKELAGELERRGARVSMTRTRDVFIELDRRAATAEKTGTDLLVSVHADSHANRSIAGATVYVARGAGAQSKRVAAAVERALRAAGIATRGVRSADFRVLAGHRRPAILVECGYLTNPVDAKNLGSSVFRETIATAIANGIADGV